MKFDQFNVVAHGATTEYVSSMPGILTLVKLHGHYTLPQLANLDEETRRLSGRLRRYFESLMRDHGLIVCGYAGRDRSIMEPITKAVRARTVPRGVIWCLRRNADLTAAPYLRALEESGKGNVHFLRIGDADEFYSDLHHRLGLPEQPVLDAVSSQHVEYQRKKMLERLATGMSLALEEEMMERDFRYERVYRRDEVDMVENSFRSTRRLRIHNLAAHPVQILRHLECGEIKITHNDLELQGRVMETGEVVAFRPLGDPDLSFCRAFEIVLPAAVAPGAETEIEYQLTWPAEPAQYGQQPHSQSVSLIRYARGVGSLDFRVAVRSSADQPMRRAWVFGVADDYHERTLVEDASIEARVNSFEFAFRTKRATDRLYVLYYLLGAAAAAERSQAAALA